MQFLTSKLAIIFLATAAWTATTPDGTCGNEKAGDNKAFTCTRELPCCSSYGYCGASDAYCLSSTGCQSAFSFSENNITSTACYAPRNGTVSPDGTCGRARAGVHGYKCPSTPDMECCSVAGWCGNTADHCAASNGCQASFGKCI
ncbi:uncharacterized protein BCR38DRAFT_404575 [Pseudomassariella vexata]|uniref:Chitin-binding type-1 domain-containing protein n=1 Tax=Pseudomassariella vexata TaxID=1141098 RepID=A0A1Y2EIV4_9PEZI|nr:uncharacterized protein BCR38DRAFT_404575 [Pseudomassariella vexata]ORY71493.1 hypothetical protein BCR38DRAFT_404575 [Pseudomassariella vexata]